MLVGARSANARIIGVILVGSTLALAWSSTIRAVPILWLVFGAIALSRKLTPIWLVFWILSIAILIVVFVQVFGFDPPGFYEDSRFSRIRPGRSDFAYGRLIEATDVWHTYVGNANLLQIVLGFGYGATFEANAVYETVPVIGERITSGGVAHVIHFGPMRMLFRYGVLGLSILVVLFVVAMRDVYALMLRRVDFSDSRHYPLFATAILGYLLWDLLQPVTNGVVFAYTLAGYLVTRAQVVKGRNGSGLS